MTSSGPFSVEYRDTRTLRHSRPYKLLADAIDREQIDWRKSALNGETTTIVRVLDDGTYAALETDDKPAVDQQINRSATTEIDTIGERQ